ncbi:type 1 glutamine amidotransferase [Nesterenkonia populi]
MTKILVIQHEEAVGIGRLGAWLEDAGAQLVMCRPDQGEAVPAGFDDVDGLLVLGGTAAPQRDDHWPWLPAVRALQKRAVDGSFPALNICLGAQLCAVAYGVDVFRRDKPQVGVHQLTLRPEASQDPLFAGLPPQPKAVLWHQEEIAGVPQGAVHLVEGTDAPVQAFRMGESSWSLQFHPEPDEHTVRAWAAAEGSLVPQAGESTEQVLTGFRDQAAEIEASFRPLAERFVDVCRAGGAA